MSCVTAPSGDGVDPFGPPLLYCQLWKWDLEGLLHSRSLTAKTFTDFKSWASSTMGYPLPCALLRISSEMGIWAPPCDAAKGPEVPWVSGLSLLR